MVCRLWIGLSHKGDLGVNLGRKCKNKLFRCLLVYHVSQDHLLLELGAEAPTDLLLCMVPGVLRGHGAVGEKLGDWLWLMWFYIENTYFHLTCNPDHSFEAVSDFLCHLKKPLPIHTCPQSSNPPTVHIVLLAKTVLLVT